MGEQLDPDTTEGLSDPDLLRELLVPPASGREVSDEEIAEFVPELQILMRAVEEVAARGKVYVQINAEFAGGAEPRTVDDRLNFNFSTDE